MNLGDFKTYLSQTQELQNLLGFWVNSVDSANTHKNIHVRKRTETVLEHTSVREDQQHTHGYE